MRRTAMQFGGMSPKARAAVGFQIYTKKPVWLDASYWSPTDCGLLGCERVNPLYEAREGCAATRKTPLLKEHRPHTSDNRAPDYSDGCRPKTNTFSATHNLPPSFWMTGAIDLENEALVNPGRRQPRLTRVSSSARRWCALCWMAGRRRRAG